MFKFFAAVAFVLGMGQAQGAERVHIEGVGRVPYSMLFEVVSEPGETMDAFALRLAPRLRAFSDETGHEACGAIGRAADGRLGAVIGSNGSHVACAVFGAKVPAGMVATGQSIHSHGGERAARANKADLALMGKHLAEMGGAGRAAVYVNGQTLDAFSQVDFHGGPGYLAIPGARVLHQSGTPHSVRVVHAPD